MTSPRRASAWIWSGLVTGRGRACGPRRCRSARPRVAAGGDDGAHVAAARAQLEPVRRALGATPTSPESDVARSENPQKPAPAISPEPALTGPRRARRTGARCRWRSRWRAGRCRAGPVWKGRLARAEHLVRAARDDVQRAVLDPCARSTGWPNAKRSIAPELTAVPPPSISTSASPTSSRSPPGRRARGSSWCASRARAAHQASVPATARGSAERPRPATTRRR